MWKDHDPPDGIGIDFDGIAAPPPATLGDKIRWYWDGLVFAAGMLFRLLLAVGAMVFVVCIWTEYRAYQKTLPKPTTVFEQEQTDEPTHRRPRR